MPTDWLFARFQIYKFSWIVVIKLSVYCQNFMPLLSLINWQNEDFSSIKTAENCFKLPLFTAEHCNHYGGNLKCWILAKKNIKSLVTGNYSWWWSLWAATWSSTNELRQKHSSCSSIWTIPYGPYFITGGNTHFLHQNSSEYKVIVHVLCPWCRINGSCVVVFFISIVYQARHIKPCLPWRQIQSR